MTHAPPIKSPISGPSVDVFDGIALAIFDFDGVVADSEVLSLGTLQQALADFGLPLDAATVRQTFLGTSLTTMEAYLRRHGPNQDTTGFRAHWQAMLFERLRRELQPMPDVVPLFDTLRAAQIPYCIASSGTLERLGIAIGTLGLTQRLPHVFSAEQVKNGKPAPDLFLHAAAQMGVPAAQSLVIEDSHYGVRAAKAAGMRCAGFVGGTHLDGIRPDHACLLTENGADHVLDRFAGLRVAPAARFGTG